MKAAHSTLRFPESSLLLEIRAAIVYQAILQDTNTQNTPSLQNKSG